MRKPVLFMLLAALLLLSACGPAVKPAAGPVTESGEVFTIALPRLVVDYDARGNPSIQGVDLATIDSITRSNISGALRLPNNYDYAGWMMSANVQHVELRQAGSGLVVLINGRPLPYLAWDDNSLQTTTTLMHLLDTQNAQVDTQFIGRLLPIVRRLGLDLVLRFPRQSGVAEIPLADVNDNSSLATKTTGNAPYAIAQFEVKYDKSGVPAILGVSAADLAQRGINMGNIALAPDAIRRLQAANIQSMELRGKEDGLYVYVNGQALPNIAWDNTMLGNAAQVYGQMNDQTDQRVQTVQQLLPLVNKADVAVLVHFPVAVGKQPIAVKMH